MGTNLPSGTVSLSFAREHSERVGGQFNRGTSPHSLAIVIAAKYPVPDVVRVLISVFPETYGYSFLKVSLKDFFKTNKMSPGHSDLSTMTNI